MWLADGAGMQRIGRKRGADGVPGRRCLEKGRGGKQGSQPLWRIFPM